MALVKDGPKRLEVKQPAFSKRAIVTFDGDELGRFETHAELLAGRTFPLPDGTTLLVQLDPAKPAFLFGEPARLRVERDGALLRGCPAHPASVVKQGAAVLWFVAILSIVFGSVLAFADREGPGAGIGTALEGLVFAGFAWGASREKRWALIAGLSLYVLDTVVGLASAGAGGWIVRVVVIFTLIRAIRAHPELARVDTASVADVFR
jgi:hypothetical protein